MKNHVVMKGLLGAVLLLLSPCLAQAQTFSLHYTDTPVARVLSDLEGQTDYSFVYQKQVLEGVPNVTCSMDGVTLTVALDEICRNLGLSYEIVQKSIVIRKAEQPGRGGVRRSGAGRITDAQGEPLIGVTVHNVTSGQYATSDVDGSYSILAAQGDEIVFEHYAGYSNIEENKPITKHSMFSQASTTKLFTYAILGMIYEEGKFLFSDPLYYYLPEWKNTRKYVMRANGEIDTEPLEKPITIRDAVASRRRGPECRCAPAC